MTSGEDGELISAGVEVGSAEWAEMGFGMLTNMCNGCGFLALHSIYPWIGNGMGFGDLTLCVVSDHRGTLGYSRSMTISHDCWSQKWMSKYRSATPRLINIRAVECKRPEHPTHDTFYRTASLLEEVVIAPFTLTTRI